MKFLHTADWQIGMKAAQAGAKAKEVRARRIASAHRIAEIAKTENVDFVVIAGDLFDSPDVDEAMLKRAADVLDEFSPIPVFVLPGNHDPLGSGSVWERRTWKQVGSHVHLLRSNEPVVAVEGTILYPCPLKQKRSSLDPTEGIPARAVGEGEIRIGVAHGALDILPEKGNFPIRTDRAQVAGLDYLALGDWHSTLISGKAAYAGTPETTSYDEPDSGNVLVVTVPRAGAAVDIRRFHVGSLTWLRIDQDVTDGTDVRVIETRIRDAGPREAALVRARIRIAASVTPDAQDRLRALQKELKDEVFVLDWEVAGRAAVSMAALPDGVLSRADAILAAVESGTIPSDRPSNLPLEPELASRARQLLRALAQEAGA